ncbi:hypothetical protein MNBD_UNCLBAC01-241 [hydrothermal vent metagenome]|uniref:Uncharacterized protein n=1 Tax=hydrothermal vent metagenome TaxID=652676 RepID=A0A3B1CZD7_9ZZZZ
MDDRCREEVEMRGALTLPRVVLQICLQGEMPPKELIRYAMKSLDEVASQLVVRHT